MISYYTIIISAIIMVMVIIIIIIVVIRIITATFLDVYRYSPTNFKELKKSKAKMYETGFVFAV